MERPTLLYKYICNICDDLHVCQRHEIKMQKIVKENQNPIETLPWRCIEYEWREDKGCPRSHLSRPETAT